MSSPTMRICDMFAARTAGAAAAAAVLLLLPICTHSFSLEVPSFHHTAAPASRRQSVILAASTSASAVSPPKDNLVRADARGAALLLEDVSVYRGDACIIRNIPSWRVEPKDKWAIVGTNGAGKSTLLQAIMNDEDSGLQYDGTVLVGTKQEVGYLRQTAVSGSNLSIFDEAASGMTGILQARATMEAIQTRIAEQGEEPSEKDLEELDRATQNFERVGGYTADQEVSTVLKGLGFTNLDQNCNELSGGWQMRVAFAKLLLSKPTLCLLDEPSNHLDRAARSWLANYLKRYTGGAMILVTHDTELLQSMDHIAEVTAGTLQVYRSVTYDQYQNQKKERFENAQKEYEANMEEAAKLQAFVDRFGASATKASAAQSRVKKLEKMKAAGLLDAPPEAISQKRFKPTLNLPDPPKALGDVLLSLEDAEIGYESGKPLVTRVNLEITRGMKLLIRGPNGAGKSTLLHTLRGEIPLLDGKRNENERLYLGTFTQDLAQELELDARAVDLVTAHARSVDATVSDEQARGVLGALGLRGDKALRTIRALSGGEKARVALGMFALKASNLYLLDEVSNHLDLECVEALSESLSDWGDEEGAIVVISHDKSFCQQIGFTHVATVQDGSLTFEQRNTRPSDWDSWELTEQPSSLQSSGDKDQPKEPEMDAKTRKKAYNAPKRIAKLEEMITAKEEKIAVIDQEMLSAGTDVGKLVDLTAEKEKLETEVMEHMEEWEELESLVSLL